MNVLYGLCNSMWQCGSVRQCDSVLQCSIAAVRAAVCGSAHGSMRTVCAIVYGSVLGSVWQCARQCAAVWQCDSVQ
jgi:hypothetical protein